MPVYMVYVCHSVSDRAQLEKYWASIAPTLEGVSIKFLAAIPEPDVQDLYRSLGIASQIIRPQPSWTQSHSD